MNTIGKFIREKRKEKGWTQKQFADEMKISRPFILEIEVGRKVFSSDRLKELIKVLKLNKDEEILMYDLAAKFKNDIPEDIREFLLNNPEMYKEIRSKIHNAV